MNRIGLIQNINQIIKHSDMFTQTYLYSLLESSFAPQDFIFCI